MADHDCLLWALVTFTAFGRYLASLQSFLVFCPICLTFFIKLDKNRAYRNRDLVWRDFVPLLQGYLVSIPIVVVPIIIGRIVQLLDSAISELISKSTQTKSKCII